MGDILGGIGQFGLAAAGVGQADQIPDRSFRNEMVSNAGVLSSPEVWGPINQRLGKEMTTYTDLYNKMLPAFLKGASTERGSRVNDMMSYNSLMPSLVSSARTGLDLGSRWAPEDLNAEVNRVRGDWAGRGLGASLPASYAESLDVLGGGEGLKRERQGFASGVSDRLNSTTFGGDGQGYGQFLGFFNPMQARMNPESSYASQMYGQNYQGRLTTELYNAQEDAKQWDAANQQTSKGIGAAGMAFI